MVWRRPPTTFNGRRAKIALCLSFKTSVEELLQPLFVFLFLYDNVYICVSVFVCPSVRPSVCLYVWLIDCMYTQSVG